MTRLSRSRFSSINSIGFFTFFFLLLITSVKSQFFLYSGDTTKVLAKKLETQHNLKFSKLTKFYLNDIDLNFKAEFDSIKSNVKTKPIIINSNNFKILKKDSENTFWYINVGIKNANWINILLSDIVLSDNAKLYFIGGSGYNIAGPITKQMIGNNNKYLNTGQFISDNITILISEKTKRNAPESSFSTKWVTFNNDKIKNLKVAATPADIACFFPQFYDASFSVAKMITNVGDCTCTIVNNEANNRVPFALSARHCITTGSGSAPLTQTDIDRLATAGFRFNYRHSTCGGSNNSADFQSTGATFIASSYPTDYLFIRLNNDLPPIINYWSWNRNPQVPFPASSINHFDGNQQRLSIGLADDATTQFTKYKVIWDSNSGITEGSSGAGLLNPQKELTGMLSWDQGIFTPTYFAKLSSAFANNSALATNLTPSQNLTQMPTLVPFRITGGVSQLCYGQSTTFSMPNLRPTETVSWSVTAGLDIVSTSQASHSVTVTSNSPTSGFNATITATYTEPSTSVNYSTSATQRVGFPTYSELTLTNVSNGAQASNYGTISLISNSTNSLQASHPGAFSGANWNFPSSWSVGTNGYTYNTIYNWNTNGNSIAIYPQNQCGTSVQPAMFFVSGSYYSYRVSPNPATSFISITFENAEDIDMLPDEINLWDDKSKKALKSIKVKEKHLNGDLKASKKIELDVKDLSRGLYYVQILNAKRKDLPKDAIKIILE